MIDCSFNLLMRSTLVISKLISCLGTLACLCSTVYAEEGMLEMTPKEGVDYIRISNNEHPSAPSRLDMLFSSANDAPGASTPIKSESVSAQLVYASPPDIALPPTKTKILFNSEQFYPREQTTQTAMRENMLAPALLNTPQRFNDLIAQIAQEERLDKNLLHAIVSVESNYDHLAVSPKGAIGLMQLMPDTATRFGASNPKNPLQNLRAGARYLKFLQGMYQGKLPLILAAYNAGEGNVKKYNDRIPPFAETRSYVNKVLKLYSVSTPTVQFNLSADGRMGWISEEHLIY